MSNVKTREIKTKFSIEGEKQLKSALQENAAQAKELKSEMALLDAKFADATDSEEYLAEKAEILARQVETAEDKVNLYEDALGKAVKRQQEIADAVEASRKVIEQQEQALEEARKEYGDASEQAQKLNAELEYSRKVLSNQEAQLSKANKSVSDYRTSTNYAQAAVEKLSKEADKGKKSVSELGRTMGEASDSNSAMNNFVGELANKLGIDLPNGSAMATGSLGALTTGIGVGVAVFKTYIEVLSAVIQKMVEVSVEAGEWAMDIEKLSAQTGMATDRIQQLGYAAGQTNVDIDKIADSTKDLQQALAAAEDPTSEEARLFKELGISVKNADGFIRSAGEIWEPLMERLSRMTDRTKQAAVANDLMGESYFELQPILQDYAKFMEEANSEAARSATLNEEEIQRLTEVSGAYQKLNNSIEHVKRAMATQSAQDLIEAMNQMNNVVTEIGDYLLDSGSVESLGKYVEFLSKMVDLFLALINIPGVDGFFDMVNGGLDKMTDGLEIITRSLDKLLSQSDAVVTAMLGPLGLLFGPTGSLITGVGNSIYNKTRGYAAGTPSAAGGVATVGEYGPERVYLPKGAQVMNARDTAATAGGRVVNITVNANVPDLATLQQIIDFYENYEITKQMG